MKESYANNRERFGKLMENGSMLVLFAGTAPVFSGSQSYAFTPRRNFCYLTGIDRPKLIFTMTKNAKGEVNEKLYLERYDELYARWNDAMIQKEQAEEISGIGTYGFIDEFLPAAAASLNSGSINTIYLDLECRSFDTVTPDLEFAQKVRNKFPHINISNGRNMIFDLRLIKADYELENLRKAGQVTKEAFYAMMRNVKPGLMEYELEAYIEYTYKRFGTQKAFNTILASGGNAAVLHYNHNNCEIKDGDLILTDFGAGWNHYSADLTRTFPANGKFTERQKQLYNIVLRGQELVISMVKPGIEFGKLNESLREYYAVELVKIGLIKDKDEISKYYFHQVSHMLGLDTHDLGRATADLVLKPGMVLTVEPGLYIPEENIGIRIEDDVVVTKDGNEVLTRDIIRTIEEIEAYMAENRA